MDGTCQVLRRMSLSALDVMWCGDWLSNLSRESKSASDLLPWGTLPLLLHVNVNVNVDVNVNVSVNVNVNVNHRLWSHSILLCHGLLYNGMAWHRDRS